MSATGLSGVHVALATPLSPDGRSVDHDGLARLVERTLQGGVRAICPVGSTGEGPRLTRAVRHDITATVRSVAGRTVPVIPAPSAPTAAEAISEIGELVQAGADAVLLAPPSYYPMTADEIGEYFHAVAEATAAPIVLYNIPAMTKVSLPAPVVASLATHENIIGIKDSSRDFEYLQSVLYAVGDADFTVLTGSDTMLLPSMLLGAGGTIAASANVVPQLGRQVYDAVTSGDLESAASAQRHLFDVVQACRVGTMPAGWKAALAAAGVCSPALVAPARGLDDDRRAALTERLRQLRAI